MWRCVSHQANGIVLIFLLRHFISAWITFWVCLGFDVSLTFKTAFRCVTYYTSHTFSRQLCHVRKISIDDYYKHFFCCWYVSMSFDSPNNFLAYNSTILFRVCVFNTHIELTFSLLIIKNIWIGYEYVYVSMTVWLPTTVPLHVNSPTFIYQLETYMLFFHLTNSRNSIHFKILGTVLKFLKAYKFQHNRM